MSGGTSDDEGGVVGADEPAVRLVVRHGSDLDAEVVAALTVALTPPAASRGPGEQRGTPWARAALLEGLGTRIVAEPADLERPAGLR